MTAVATRPAKPVNEEALRQIVDAWRVAIRQRDAANLEISNCHAAARAYGLDASVMAYLLGDPKRTPASMLAQHQTAMRYCSILRVMPEETVR